MRNSTGRLSAIVAIGFFLVAPYAEAQVANSDQITISAIPERTVPQFGSNTGAQGSPACAAGCFNPLPALSIPEGAGDNLLNYFIGFRPSTPTQPHGATFNTAVELIESNGSISDIIELSIVSIADVTGASLGQNWTLNFFSDTEGGAALQHLTGLVGAAVQVQETGSSQDISGLFLDSDGRTRITPLFNVLVQSDLNAVPEPSTLVLLECCSAPVSPR